ncbi:MAG: hypothetical protein ALECFALPRED_001376 [Alectoria fallacina]|uniref:Cytochrome P450 n=1 Tax=Alectoria fallacina TaxID=1903189 RepID=A0A8H3IIE6_9LECA|nr:MAG: hypothetical protein ALECFALPRED_001376 [Alectoria fallacina]
MFLDAREGADSLIPLEFSECKDWSPIQVYPKLLRVVSRINTKTLIGNGLQENNEWIDINTKRHHSTQETFSYPLQSFEYFLHFCVLWLSFSSPNSAVWDCNRRARDIIAPILADRVVREKSGDFKKPLDSVEWFRDDTNDPKDKNDPELHALIQLLIGALSVNTTTQLITNSIFNLATQPEYVPILRDEIDNTLREAGGKWTMESMAQLEKLDSFIKETLRHSGHLTLTFHRVAQEPITLSDGTDIPKGSTLFSPANAINFDPEIYPNPETFDGLRFYKLRHASPENVNKFQLTSLTGNQMQFGAGRHACPGRAIAGHQVKLILAHLLEKYELKLKDGEGRPKPILFQTNQFPNPQGEILFKDRK